MATRERTVAMRVRPARPSDVPALARIHVESWHRAYAHIIAPHNLAKTTLDRSETRFRGFFRASGRTRIDLLEGPAGPIGYVNYGVSETTQLGARGEVYELYLAPEAQGRGAGRSLLAAGLWGLAAAGLLPVQVWVLRDNLRARRFYARMRGRELAVGWVDVGDQRLAKVAYGWANYLPWPEHQLGAAR